MAGVEHGERGGLTACTATAAATIAIHSISELIPTQVKIRPITTIGAMHGEQDEERLGMSGSSVVSLVSDAQN